MFYTFFLCEDEDGDILFEQDGKHSTIESANDYFNEVGSKWFFYPWTAISTKKYPKILHEVYTGEGIIPRLRIRN